MSANPDRDERTPVWAAAPSPTLIDYPNRMAGVLFFSGCNLRCGFCHNARFLGDADPGRCLTWGELDAALDRFRDQWADAVVLTGGEPTIADACRDVIRRCRARGFSVKLDTNGTRPDRVQEALPHLSYVALDIKASPETYPSLTGLADPTCLSESLRILRAGTPDYELRTTVIEAVHTDEEMERIAEWIRGARRWILQPFIPRDHLPDATLRREPRTRPQRLTDLQTRFADAAEEVLVRA